MNIYLIKNGQNAGPYSEPEVRSRVQAGSYTLDDLAWFDGCTGPIPLTQFFAKPPSVALGLPPTPAPSSASAPALAQAATPEFHPVEELTQIAELQKKLIILGVGWVVYCFVPVPEFFKSIEGPLALVAFGYWIRFGWRLARLLHEKPWVWVVFSLIPLLNFYAWGRIIWTATKTLRANGIPCGFWGADQAALNRLGKTV